MADAPAAAEQRALTSRELVSLQLHARGYRPPQCRAVAGHPEGDRQALLAAAASALGLEDPAGVVDEAGGAG
jgi:hypothetical protein